MMKSLLVALLFALLLPNGQASNLDEHAAKLAPLIDPAKLATLGKRAANPRLQKSVALLETARLDGCDISAVAGKADNLAHYTNATLAKLTAQSLARNHMIAERLGVLNPAGLADMRRGQSPTIQRGPCMDDERSVHLLTGRRTPDRTISPAFMFKYPRNQRDKRLTAASRAGKHSHMTSRWPECNFLVG